MQNADVLENQSKIPLFLNIAVTDFKVFLCCYS